MGSCACQQSNLDWLGQEVYKIPEPSIFRSDNFLCLNYKETSSLLSTFEDLKQSLSDYMITEVTKLAILNPDDSVNKLVIYLACTDNVIVRLNVMIEISEDKLILQICKPYILDLLLSCQKKRIIVQYRPSIADLDNNMIFVIDSIYRAKLNKSKEVASTKNIMKYIKEIIKS